MQLKLIVITYCQFTIHNNDNIIIMEDSKNNQKKYPIRNESGKGQYIITSNLNERAVTIPECVDRFEGD